MQNFFHFDGFFLTLKQILKELYMDVFVLFPARVKCGLTVALTAKCTMSDCVKLTKAIEFN